MIKVVIAGARGRMGVAAVGAVTQAADLELVGVLDYKYEGQFLTEQGEVTTEQTSCPIYTSFEQLIDERQPAVYIDLTSPDVVVDNMTTAIKNGVYPVVGTSGLTMEAIDQLNNLCKQQGMGGIIAPNFSIGAVLMMKFSAMAAKYLTDIEVIELHHDKKLDAPSGTAMKTMEMIKDVRTAHLQGHPNEKETIPGARGANIEGMRLHSVRLPGLLAHQEVLLGSQGELLTIKHDSFDRQCFMPGVLLAVREVQQKKELIYGLEHIID